ncbi:hypothetical protein ACFTXM_45675 [Streptomyces sp. NPDC056930]|uniref:hypothetical protein n=2 Tax=unclassified Streptomyces TaxID=2593676 RepID=UPI00362E2E0C
MLSSTSATTPTATETTAVDEWLADPEFLVTADPERVIALLDVASSPAARVGAAVYRVSAELHRAGVRRQLLALDTARYGERELSARIAAVVVEGEPAGRWSVEWSSGSRLDPRCRPTPNGCLGQTTAIATLVVDGRTLAVTGHYSGAVAVRDPVTGRQVGRQPMTGHTRRVSAVATTLLDGCPVAVTGGDDVRV